jgi:hypothetical protein
VQHPTIVDRSTLREFSRPPPFLVSSRGAALRHLAKKRRGHGSGGGHGVTVPHAPFAEQSDRRTLRTEGGRLTRPQGVTTITRENLDERQGRLLNLLTALVEQQPILDTTSAAAVYPNCEWTSSRRERRIAILSA